VHLITFSSRPSVGLLIHDADEVISHHARYPIASRRRPSFSRQTPAAVPCRSLRGIRCLVVPVARDRRKRASEDASGAYSIADSCLTVVPIKQEQDIASVIHHGYQLATIAVGFACGHPNTTTRPYHPVAVITPLSRQAHETPNAIANTFGSQSADQILPAAAPDAPTACTVPRVRPHRERRKTSTQRNGYATTGSIASRCARDASEPHVPANIYPGHGHTCRYVPAFSGVVAQRSRRP
jgi:hypothetical protein